MKKIQLVVMVLCTCGKWVTIRTYTTGASVVVICWNCGKGVWFIVTGFMKAAGRVTKGINTVVTKAIVKSWKEQ